MAAPTKAARPAAAIASTGPNVGQRAPDFAVASLDGSTLTLADFRANGDPVMLFFFTTW